jgi:hypothetical protein
MRLAFKHMTVLESILVVFAGFVFFIVSGYVWAVIRFFSLFL